VVCTRSLGHNTSDFKMLVLRSLPKMERRADGTVVTGRCIATALSRGGVSARTLLDAMVSCDHVRQLCSDLIFSRFLNGTRVAKTIELAACRKFM